MTHAERAVLEATVDPPQRAPWRWTEDPQDARLVWLTAGPCPLLGTDLTGAPTCTVYAVRPYVCRRFMCGRPDVTTEPFEPGGPLGCHNLTDRLEQSLTFHEHYRTRQRHAQREWADTHGWSREMT